MSTSPFRRVAIGLLLSGTSLLLTLLAIEGLIGLLWHPIDPRVDSRTLGGAMTTGGANEWTRFVPGAESVVVSPTAEFAVSYSINSLGLRDRERSKRKENGNPRVLVIGDSFAEGYGVRVEESFTAVAESEAPDRWEWINGGIRGLSPGKAFFRLQDYLLLGLEVDLVLLQVHDNDFEDDRRYREEMELTIDTSGLLSRRACRGIERILQLAGPFEWRVSHTNLYRLLHTRRFLESTGHHELDVSTQIKDVLVGTFRRFEISGLEIEAGVGDRWKVRFPELPERILPVEAQRELWVLLETRNLGLSNRRARTVLSRLQRGIPVRHPPPPKEPFPEDVQSTFSYLDALLKLTRSQDIPLLVYYQPRSNRLAFSPENRWFEHWSRLRGVPFLSLRESLAIAVLESSDPLYFPIDGHLTALGHKWVGERLASWTADRMELSL